MNTSLFTEGAIFALGMLSAFTMAGLHVCRVNRRMIRTEERNTWEREQRNNAINAMDKAHIRSEELAREIISLRQRLSDVIGENDQLSRALHGNLEAEPILAVMEGMTK